jgi:DNA-binding protein Fis
MTSKPEVSDVITIPLTMLPFVDAKEGEIYKSVIGSVESSLLDSILRLKRGNQVQASKLLGINRNTLRKKMVEFNLDKIDYSDLTEVV